MALARAFVRNPSILLLDEATSALDAHAEAQVQGAIAAVAGRCTTVMVAHRLASVQKADRIVVVVKGRVVECGTHGELVARGGVYAGMVGAQDLG